MKEINKRPPNWVLDPKTPEKTSNDWYQQNLISNSGTKQPTLEKQPIKGIWGK